MSDAAYYAAYYQKNRKAILVKKRPMRRRHYVANREKLIEYERAQRVANPRLFLFRDARQNAKRRGIEFLFTLDEWLSFWEGDFEFRGTGPDALCMGRFGDVGPYRLGNVYKCSNSENQAGPRPLPVPDF